MESEATEKPKVWLNRRRASLWLEAKYGMRCSVATLAKKAVRGTGPEFAYMGPLCVYTPEDLDSCAQSQISEKVHSTAGRANPRDPFRRRGRPRRTAAASAAADLDA
jgi:hypothetical protein